MKLRELERTHRRRLAACFLLIVVTGVVFLSYAVVTLFQDRASEDDYWEKSFTETDSLNQELAQRSRSAVPVEIGTYIENLKEVSIKTSSFRAVMLVWFKWEGKTTLI